MVILLDSDTHQLAARAHSSLLEEALQNRLHIALGDLQPPGDLFVGKAFQHEAQDVALPFVEYRSGGLWSSARIFRHRGEGAVEPGATGRDVMDGGDEF